MIRSRRKTQQRWTKRNEDINLSRVMGLNNYRELRALRSDRFTPHEFMAMASVLCHKDPIDTYYGHLVYLIREWCADPSIKPSPISAKQMMSLHERRA